MSRDLTTGNIYKLILTYAGPLLVANLLQAVYNVVDMIVVGQVNGGVGMAAVSVGTDILHLVTSLVMGFTSAGQILISQYVGAGKKESVSRMTGTMYTVTLLMALVICGLCFFGLDTMLGWLNTPAESYSEARIYLLTCSLGGIVFMTGYNTTCAILRGMGDSKHPCIFIAIAAILNIILDVWFVAGLKMGAFGAALATVIGQAVSFISAIIFLYKRRDSFGFDFKLKSFKVEKSSMTPLIKLGIPMSIQAAAIHVSKILLASWINACGFVFTAIAGVYNKINMMLSTVTNSLNTAGGAICGQNIGAGKFDRVPKTLLWVGGMCGVVSLTLGLAIGFFPSAIFSLFTTDEAVLALSPIIVLPMIINFFGNVGRCTAFSLINGSGNSKINLLVAIIDGIIARIGLAAYLGFVLNMSARGFWLGDACAGLIPFIIGLFFFISGKWKKSRA